MFVISTRNFPPEIGGMQNLMGGLANALINHGPVKVFTYEYENSKNYDNYDLKAAFKALDKNAPYFETHNKNHFVAFYKIDDVEKERSYGHLGLAWSLDQQNALITKTKIDLIISSTITVAVLILVTILLIEKNILGLKYLGQFYIKI